MDGGHLLCKAQRNMLPNKFLFFFSWAAVKLYVVMAELPTYINKFYYVFMKSVAYSL